MVDWLNRIKRIDGAELAVRGLAALSALCWLVVIALPDPFDKADTPTSLIHANEHLPNQINVVIAPPDQVERPLFVWAGTDGDAGRLPRQMSVVAGSTIMVATNSPGNVQVTLGSTPIQFLKDDGAMRVALIRIDRAARLQINTVTTHLTTDFEIAPDSPPQASFATAPVISPRGILRFALKADDDLGLVTASLSFTGDGAPDPVLHDLTVPAGSTKLRDIAYVDLRDSKLAGAAVNARLVVTDTKGQLTQTDAVQIYVPDRRFRSTEAALIDAQRARLERDADTTNHVALMLRRLAEEHLELDQDGPHGNGLDAGLVLGYAVAYHRLTGLSLNDPLPPWPLMPAEENDIAASLPLLRSLAVRVDDRKLKESDENFKRATRNLEATLSHASSPKERQAAVWQWRAAVRTQLVALFLDAIRYGKPFLLDIETSEKGNPQGHMPHVMSRQMRQLTGDLLDEDWTAARQRIDAIEDALGFAMAGTIGGARRTPLATFASLSGWAEDTKHLLLDWHTQDAESLKEELANLLHKVALSPLEDLSADQRRALQNDIERLIRHCDDAGHNPVAFNEALPMMADFHIGLISAAQAALNKHLRLKPRLVNNFNRPVISKADHDRVSDLLKAVPLRVGMQHLTPFYRALERMQVIDVTAQQN